MANHFVTLPEGSFIASMSYSLNMQGASNNGVSTSGFYQTLLFSQGFGTGQDEDGTLTFSYDNFDQDAVEAAITAFMNAWCAYTVAVTGFTLEQIQGWIQITREWYVEIATPFPNFTGAAGYQINDIMPYTPVI